MTPRTLLAEAHHCKDCCCARSWAALGIADYTGMSIAEHIADLSAKLAKAQTDLALARSDARIKSDADYVRGLERTQERTQEAKLLLDEAEAFWHQDQIVSESWISRKKIWEQNK